MRPLQLTGEGTDFVETRIAVTLAWSVCVFGESARERETSQIERMCAQSRSFAKNTAASVFMDVQRPREGSIESEEEKKVETILFISLTTPCNGLLIHCCSCECPLCSRRHFYVQSNWQEFQSDSLI